MDTIIVGNRDKLKIINYLPPLLEGVRPPPVCSTYLAVQKQNKDRTKNTANNKCTNGTTTGRWGSDLGTLPGGKVPQYHLLALLCLTLSTPQFRKNVTLAGRVYPLEKRLLQKHQRSKINYQTVDTSESWQYLVRPVYK